ncbi:DUF5103 domain-containing protein [Bacteroidia bacterium]|nr:DUF5103 domain-containing protein [Bacteroidia bacterium]
MKKGLLCVFSLLVFVTQAQVYRTETLTADVQTLRVSVADNGQMTVDFDVLGGDSEQYTYRIFHCNADWTPSDIPESDYLTGFQNLPLEDFTYSFNTKPDYVHYRLQIPNEDVSLKISGNYVLQIFQDGDTQPVLNACFWIVEPKAEIAVQVSPITDKGANSTYQAVRIEVNYSSEIRNPSDELKIYVQQNNRRDNAVFVTRPLQLQNRKAIYDHHPGLIFDAGNEYRAFEMITHNYPGMNIESVEYYDPYYHSILRPDRMRSDRAYLFDEDIDGKFVIRNMDAQDSDTEADYQLVHFFLPCKKPLAEPVYLLSEAFHHSLNARSKMEYSEQERGYVKTALLKEGYYNYLYVTRNGNSPASTTAIEGNYYQTENEYRVMVYARPVGARYDQLIGVKTLKYK